VQLPEAESPIPTISLSSGKGSIHEGGIREPMIVKWPGVVTPGSENNNYLIIEDFFPSILEIAGIDQYHTAQTMDGKSFVPLLKNNLAAEQDRPLFWHFPNEWGPTGPGLGAFSAIRKGEWKLIYYHQDQRFELFNIDSDIGETSNLSDSHQKIRDKLAEVLTHYLQSVDAQMPKNKQSGELIPMPNQSIKQLPS